MFNEKSKDLTLEQAIKTWINKAEDLSDHEREYYNELLNKKFDGKKRLLDNIGYFPIDLVSNGILEGEVEYLHVLYGHRVDNLYYILKKITSKTFVEYINRKNRKYIKYTSTENRKCFE